MADNAGRSIASTGWEQVNRQPRIYRRLLRRVGVGTDIGTTVLLQGIGALLAYLVNRAVARSLGPDGWDAYSLCMHTYIVIGTAVADFGIVATVMPRIAAARGEFSPAFGAAFTIRLFTFVLGLIVVASMTLIYGNAELLLPATIGFCAVLFSGRLTGMRQIPEMIWRLRGRTWVVTTIAVIDALILLGVLVVLDHTGELTLMTALIAFVVTGIPGFLVVLLPVVAAYRRSGYHRVRARPGYYRAIMVAALPVAVMAFTSQLFGRVEPLVIDATLGSAYVGDYIAGILPLAGTIFFAISVGIGLWPLISQVHRRARKDLSAGWVVSLGSRVLGGVAIMISVICFLFAEQIMAIFDPAYVQYAYILRIYSITSGLEYLVVFFDQTLLAVELRKEMMIGTLLALGLAVIFQIGAIALWGIPGILIGKIAALICKIAYQLHALGGEIRTAALKSFVPLLAAAAVPAVALIATASLPVIPRAAIALPVAAAALFASRVIDPKELKVLRRLQLT